MIKLKQKVVIFGTGLFYQRRKHLLPECVEVVAFLDNNVSIQGTEIDGKKIYSPENINNLIYDKIVLASMSWIDMRKQVLNIGIKEEYIIFWDEFISKMSHGVLKKYEVEDIVTNKNGKKILFIAYIINYSGGSLAVFNMAMLLKQLGYEVVIVSPQVLGKAVKEFNFNGINVWMCPALPYIESIELEWIREFDYVIANSLQMLVAAQRVSKYVPTMLWIHEYSGQYKLVLEQYSKEIYFSKEGMLNIYAVSNIAKRNFLTYFKGLHVGILPFGVLDKNEKENIQLCINKKKKIFAIIGNISDLKNQKELVYAMEQISSDDLMNVECWIIGRDGGKQYREELEAMIQNKRHFKICGEFSREQIQEIFEHIDVVVCTSKEETMSMSIVEGMMYGKICITNKNTGIAEFIQNGINGYVYEEGNTEELSKVICTVLKKDIDLIEIGRRARKTYKNEFSMKNFEKRMLKVLENVMREN